MYNIWHFSVYRRDFAESEFNLQFLAERGESKSNCKESSKRNSRNYLCGVLNYFDILYGYFFFSVHRE